MSDEYVQTMCNLFIKDYENEEYDGIFRNPFTGRMVKRNGKTFNHILTKCYDTILHESDVENPSEIVEGERNILNNSLVDRNQRLNDIMCTRTVLDKNKRKLENTDHSTVNTLFKRKKNNTVIPETTLIDNSFVDLPEIIMPESNDGNYRIISKIKDGSLIMKSNKNEIESNRLLVTFDDFIEKMTDFSFLEKYRKSLVLSFKYKKNLYIRKMKNANDVETQSSEEIVKTTTNIIKILNDKLEKYDVEEDDETYDDVIKELYESMYEVYMTQLTV
jgi:hypothetical protein